MSTRTLPQNQGNQMSYLKDFQTQIANHDYPALLRLWEEYCSSDELDGKETEEILKAIKATDLADSFGRHVDKILPLWEMMGDTPQAHTVFRLIIDLQSSNSDQLRELAFNFLKKKYSDQPHFNDKIRLAGLRNKDRFQGAISAYELLTHMNKGKYVFHTGGWGVGEIVEVSLVREQLVIEFDYVPGKKDLSFATAFKTLIPVPDDHFLALRFGNPDLLEEKAKDDSVEVIRMLLRDLGPKTAAEIKDEICDLIIPSKEWTKWWQATRAKVKKNTMIESPEDLKDPFRLRQNEVTHEERLQKALEKKPDAETLIQMVYSFIKDFPETLKNSQFKSSLQEKLNEILSFPELTEAQKLQIHFFLEDLGQDKESAEVKKLVKGFSSIQEVVGKIDILALKKRTLMEVRKERSDWIEIFLSMFLPADQNMIRDAILAELMQPETDKRLQGKLEELLNHPANYPETFLWYFQKVTGPAAKIPFADKNGKMRFFESLLVLLSRIEQNSEQRDLVKKIHALLSNGRYAVVRLMMQDSSIEICKEFLLLATKCHSLSDHDIKIFHSLAEVVHHSLGKLRKKQDASSSDNNQVIWTTQEGYQKLQQRIQQIATVETVENAKEIEVARAHGDLRENAEFKAALEKRDRLQSEVKFLSDQLNRSRVITKDDISTDEVGIGVIVECKNKEGKPSSYTLLGPWDANPEKGILSFQSKLAQTMNGLKVGETFQFQGEAFTITAIRSTLSKK